MKKIFRSIVNIRKSDRPTIEQGDLIRNYKSFLASKIEPEDPSYIKLYHWIEAHFREYKEIPSVHLLGERAEKDGDEAVLSSLKDIVTETPYIGSDYREILKEKFNEQSESRFQTLLTESWKVVTSGLKVGKNKDIKGIPAAIDYIISEGHKLCMGDLNIKTESNIRTKEDSEEVKEGYKERKKNPAAYLGMYTFLDQIDDVVRGLKPGELMLVAAFVKMGKTITVTNFAYYAVMQGLNGLFITLEMSHEEMRNMIYVLHASNPEWMDHPKYKNLVGKIHYNKVKYPELSSLEEEFFEVASDDFESREDFGELFVYQPSGRVTPSTIEMLAYDYNFRCKELGKSLDFIIVDYVALVSLDEKESYRDVNANLNNVIQRLKKLAITFDNGRKIRIISPFQINRTGRKEVEKLDGVYPLWTLSNAHEAERSSDLVISTFMSDEMKKAGIIKFGCMAHRRGGSFSPFEARIDWGTYQIREFIQVDKKSEFEDQETGVRNIPLDM